MSFQYKSLFTLLIIVLSSKINADVLDFKNSRISFYLGGEKNFIRDVQLSPLAYRGFNLFPFQIAYSNYNGRRLFSIDMQRSLYQAKSQNNNNNIVEINYYNFKLSYSRNTNLFLYDKRELLIGVVWQNQFNSRNYAFNNNNSSNLIFSSSNLMGQVLFSYQVSQLSRLRTSITIPLISYIIRSGYALSSPDKLINTNNLDPTFWEKFSSGDFAAINRYHGIIITIGYTKKVSEHFMLGLSYNFSYYRDYKNFLFKTASINFGAFVNYIW